MADRKPPAAPTQPPAAAAAPKPKPAKPVKEPPPAAAASAAASDAKLTPKQLKDRKKAEKAARRAESKAASAPTPAAAAAAVAAHPPRPQKGGKDAAPSPSPSASAPQSSAPPAGGIVKTIYPSAPSAAPAVKEVETVILPPKDNGLVGLLRDLSVDAADKKRSGASATAVFGLSSAHPDVHPAILTLGMQINQYVLVGSSARCLGFLLAMKRVVADYTTPAASTLTRHLPGHYLSHQIAYLLSARPMSTAMGNTIRWLKTTISALSPDLGEEAAKAELGDKIDVFIREKIALADDLIVNTAVSRYIRPGATLLTFGKSQVVERALLEARRRGVQFEVVVVDARPLEEGRNMLRGLAEAGVPCRYVCLDAVEYVIGAATTVLLGAHAVLADGAVYSRAGTAAVAACAWEAGVPVVVACESVKFSERIVLDGIVANELGDPELLVTLSDTSSRRDGPLKGWRDVENTHVASFRYDVTPPKCVKMVICEHGCVAPGSVASVLRTAAAV